MTFVSTKTWGHDVGLSCAFRQWRATHSHCQFLHGYAISVRLEFEAQELDRRNWVVDFGGLKDLKQSLQDTFDHKTVVAEDDPEISWFREGHRRGLLNLVVVPSVGCEKFAGQVHAMSQTWLERHGYSPRVRVSLVEVSEHGANSAIFRP